MNINRAIQILSKFFSVSSDIFKELAKETIIAWATRVKNEGKGYQLNWNEHAFMIGQIRTF